VWNRRAETSDFLSVLPAFPVNPSPVKNNREGGKNGKRC